MQFGLTLLKVWLKHINECSGWGGQAGAVFCFQQLHPQIRGLH